RAAPPLVDLVSRTRAVTPMMPSSSARSSSTFATWSGSRSSSSPKPSRRMVAATASLLRSQPAVGARSAVIDRAFKSPPIRRAVTPSALRGEGQHHAGRVVEAAHVAGVERDLAVGLEAGQRRAAELLRHAAHGAGEVVGEDEVAADAVEDER